MTKQQEIREGLDKVIYDRIMSFLIDNNPKLPSGCIKLFTEISVEYVLWPYFRELVQNMVVRIGLPPLTLPLKKLIQKGLV